MAHKTLRFTDEELTQANNVNLMDYAISIGLELKKGRKRFISYRRLWRTIYKSYLK